MANSKAKILVVDDKRGVFRMTDRDSVQDDKRGGQGEWKEGK